MHNSIANLYWKKQGPQETNDQYLSRFKTNINAVELVGGGYLFL